MLLPGRMLRRDVERAEITSQSVSMCGPRPPSHVAEDGDHPPPRPAGGRCRPVPAGRQGDPPSRSSTALRAPARRGRPCAPRCSSRRRRGGCSAGAGGLPLSGSWGRVPLQELRDRPLLSECVETRSASSSRSSSLRWRWRFPERRVRARRTCSGLLPERAVMKGAVWVVGRGLAATSPASRDFAMPRSTIGRSSAQTAGRATRGRDGVCRRCLHRHASHAARFAPRRTLARRSWSRSPPRSASPSSTVDLDEGPAATVAGAGNGGRRCRRSRVEDPAVVHWAWLLVLPPPLDHEIVTDPSIRDVRAAYLERKSFPACRRLRRPRRWGYRIRRGEAERSALPLACTPYFAPTAGEIVETASAAGGKIHIVGREPLGENKKGDPKPPPVRLIRHQSASLRRLSADRLVELAGGLLLQVGEGALRLLDQRRKAAGSRIARSERTFRSTSIPARASPSIMRP